MLPFNLWLRRINLGKTYQINQKSYFDVQIFANIQKLLYLCTRILIA